MISKVTSNISFKNFQYALQDAEIENCFFMNQTFDEKLVDVDVYKTIEALRNNTTEKGLFIDRVRRECEKNIWYYFREVARIPDEVHMSINDDTNLARYPLTEGMAKLIYLYDNGLFPLVLSKEYYDIAYVTLALIAIREEFFIKKDGLTTSYVDFFDKDVDPESDDYKDDFKDTMQQYLWAMNTIVGSIDGMEHTKKADLIRFKILKKPEKVNLRTGQHTYIAPSIYTDEAIVACLNNAEERRNYKCTGIVVENSNIGSFKILDKHIVNTMFSKKNDYMIFDTNFDNLRDSKPIKI